MAKDTIKNLTVSELMKQGKKLEEQEVAVIVINNTDYKIKYDKHFRKTKQHALLEDILELFNEGAKNTEILDLATPFTSLLILKHFTNVDVPEDLNEALVLLRVLIDLERLDVMINALPEDEVLKIYQLLEATVRNLDANLDEYEKEAEELAKKLENDEVREFISQKPEGE